MDLSKAKTLLIVAFLGLNIFLGYKVWTNPKSLRQGHVLTNEQIEEARDLLQAYGFHLQTSIPKQIPQLALLHVARYTRPLSFWLNIFFPECEVQERSIGQERLYACEHGILMIFDNGRVTYKAKDSPTTIMESSKALAERYLREKNLWHHSLRFDQVITEGVKENFRFIQTYQGFPLFFCVTEVYLVDGSVTDVKIDRVVPLRFAQQEVTVISALTAIEKFVAEGAQHFTNKTIVDISLGYYSQDYNASRWEVAPVWRIAAADGKAFYVNAFSGETEGSNF
ncbi:MAG: hypothetical protein GX197_01055 [Firmicutes bacterium]|nr:hypothetical protein [Bacillota bacterium]